MNVTGNGVDIPDDDTTPGVADDTDFSHRVVSKFVQSLRSYCENPDFLQSR